VGIGAGPDVGRGVALGPFVARIRLCGIGDMTGVVGGVVTVSIFGRGVGAGAGAVRIGAGVSAGAFWTGTISAGPLPGVGGGPGSN
jgi:hypothetical protein